MPAAPARVAAVDAFRGLVVLMLLAQVLRLPAVAKALPDSAAWAWLAWLQTHAEWRGVTPHDLIQPAFSFLVGVALPFSLAARAARGESAWRSGCHAVLRAAALVLLGVFLRSRGFDRTHVTLEDTLTQIGLGFVPLYLLARHAARRWQVVALAVILGGYFTLFALWPPPGPGFDWPAVGVSADWPHRLDGFAGHWNKNANPAAAADVWLLNRLPRVEPFRFNRGGYATLSFVPTLGTMVLGLFAGQRLLSADPPGRKLSRLAVAGAGCLAAGVVLDRTGLCPSVKRIWTPAWVLVSGGACYWLMALFAAVLDAGGFVRWAFPLVVVGANPIAAYWLETVGTPFVQKALVRHLGADTFRLAGAAYEPLLLGAVTLAVFWVVLWWLWRNRAFLRV